MKELTVRQRQVLDVILKYRAGKGYSPSIRELRPLLGVTSLRGVTLHLDALERKGWIKRERASRSICVLTREAAGEQCCWAPLLGTVSAGAPILAVESIQGYVPIPAEMANAGEVFALRVKGDSMTGDHIVDGDLVIVRSGPAEHGDLVTALIGDEATVKRLDTRSKPRRLVPSNPAYRPIELASNSAQILGKVIGLLRLV